MVTNKKERKAIIALLDREDAWVHVTMNYIRGVRYTDMVKFKDNGIMSRATNVGRIARSLNDIINNAMLITDPDRPSLAHEQDDLLAGERKD